MTFRKETLAEGVEVYLGDCLEVLPTLGDFDVGVFHPPYGIADTTGGTINRGRNKGDYDSFTDTREALGDLVRASMPLILARVDRAAVTPGRMNLSLYPEPRDVGIFYQPAATAMSFWGRSTWQPILYYGRDPHIGKTIVPLHYILNEVPEPNGHPCPKPIGAWSWLVERTSKPGESVLDPFMGSGTTGVACIKLGRRFTGIELDYGYFDIACRRIEAALKQADLFIATPAPRKQTSMFSDEAA